MADNEKIMQPVIRLIIILIALAVVNAIVWSLPGIGTSIPGLYWGLPAIISLVISVVMILVLVKFAFTIGPVIQAEYPNFPELATIAKNVVFLICLIIAYGAVKTISYSLYQLSWIIDIAFLLVGLYLVYIIATIFLKSSDKWSEVIVQDVKQVTSTAKVCGKCGTSNPQSNNFCDKCGTRLG